MILVPGVEYNKIGGKQIIWVGTMASKTCRMFQTIYNPEVYHSWAKQRILHTIYICMLQNVWPRMFIPFGVPSHLRLAFALSPFPFLIHLPTSTTIPAYPSLLPLHPSVSVSYTRSHDDHRTPHQKSRVG